MSVIANYVRLSDQQLAQWCANPEMLRDIVEGRVPESEHLDIDKAYEAVAWLLSDCKREEQKRQAAAMGNLDDVDPDDREAWTEALTDSFAVDYSGLTPDLILTAIEGRAEDADREARINYGLGSACVFDAETVAEINQAFQALSREDLERHFSLSVMSEQMVEPEIWDEGEAVFAEYLLPSFERLRAFYSRAAAANQKVVVVYT